MFKTSFSSGLFFLLSLSLMMGLACKTERAAKPMTASLSNYIYAYTAGTISKTAPIRVRFTKAIDGVEANQDLPGGIIQFTPSIQGQGYWEDPRTMVFVPDSPLPSNTTYLTTVNMGKLFNDLPEDARSFEFNFKTVDLFFELEIAGLEAPNPNDLSRQQLQGTLRFSDVVEKEGLEKVLQASQNGKALPVSWQSGEGQKAYSFTVSDISRSEREEQVLLSWDGSPMKLNRRGEKTVIIPSLSDFKIMEARVSQDADQSVVLQFSDPLLKNQNLTGLVTISGYIGDLRSSINGNQLILYPGQRLSGERTVSVNSGIRNTQSVRMKTSSEWALTFDNVKPQLRLVGSGVILPDADGLTFPFEAVSLNAIDVEVFKIFDNNILQFLQTNQIDGEYDLERVGRIVLQKKVSLQTLNPNANTSEWTRYAIDLQQLMQQDADAIYQIRIGFKPAYAEYFCQGQSVDKTESDLTLHQRFDESDDIESIWGDYYGAEGYYEGYDWRHREDPCYPAYYNYEIFVRRNVISSNFGILTKRGEDGSVQTIVTNLKTAEPIPGVRLEYYDYQQQLLDVVSTGSDGIAKTVLQKEPFVVIATQGEQKGYLRLMDGNALSLSRFDVAGAVAQKGMKGYIYGDRGVWRPGDSLYLNFILEDEAGKLPVNYPIHFELTDARGQVQKSITTSEKVGRIYPLHIATSSDAPTGNWIAKVKAGGASFSKTLKIETVKPNRLKIDLDFGKDKLTAADEQLSGNLAVNWLHGAPGQNLKAIVELQLRSAATTFTKYSQYVFDDPTRSFSSDPQVIYEGTTDQNGQTSISASLKTNNVAPGQLSANFRIRAFEKGGDFSTDNFTLPYLPFGYFAGVNLPKDQYGAKQIEVGTTTDIQLVALDQAGNPAANRSLELGLYRVNWRWWWDTGEDYLSNFNSEENLQYKQEKTVQTNNQGQADWTLSVDKWGRYLVRVCDPQSGHCTGDFFYAGYPWYDEGGTNREAAAMLSFTSDKDKYRVGETVELRIPTGEEGRALVSIENGSKVVQSFWVPAKKGENVFTFKATPEMTPTVYANVSLIQPHGQVQNDLPIRMYGVIPIAVEDPNTRLQPQLNIADELKPEREFTVQVSEKNNRSMSYTIAIVDDGLLDLTRFKTPDPWNSFYAREALGVKTWDIYDQVLGAHGAALERILSIGGDGAVVNKQDQKANRFKPVVMHLGPFELGKGGKATHKLMMPNYVGSVRAMVVAAADGAYGQTEKTIPVRKPLMVLASLPRVLGPSESLALPVNVFAMDQKVREVKVTVAESSGLVQFSSGSSQTVRFSQIGDQIVNFDMEVAQYTGIARFKITASGAGETATQEIEIDVRNPNPVVTNVESQVVEAGQSWRTSFEAVGMPGTNSGLLEMSTIPPINLGSRLNWLIDYPHGCVEQTTSKAMVQLFVGNLLELNEKQKGEIPYNVKEAIRKLNNFQTSDGGFSYWPGESFYNDWGSCYAGHFLLEAQKKGYAVSSGMLDRWKKLQRRLARSWTSRSTPEFDQSGQELLQAYRLFALALAAAPEMGAMNRMREMKGLAPKAKWRLAAAYALTGNKDVATALIQNLNREISPYQELGQTYGSDLRDEAMILETLVLMNDRKAAAQMVQDIAKALSDQSWLSTQTIGYSLMAVAKFVGTDNSRNTLAFSHKIGNQPSVNAGSNSPMMLINLPVEGSSNKNVEVNNTSGGILYARVITSGQPLIGDQSSAANHLEIAVKYSNTQGKAIDISTLAQGTDFIAEVTVTHPGTRAINYDEMALTQILPSGWEILNTRMDNLQGVPNSHTPEYRDIRDDRAFTYFDIRKNTSQTYRLQLNAAYLGRFYLPTISCEAMYDHSINARQPGQWVEVVAPAEG